MAADSNTGFRHGASPPSFYDHRNMLSFQAEAMPSGLFNSRTVIPAGISPRGGLIDPVPRLRRDTGLAADWTIEEQVILREGLSKFANEPSIMKYIKIAARLRDRTVRDVALRCQWITKKEHGKRRKTEEHFAGKKLKDRKDKVDSYSENLHMVNSDMSPYSLMMHHVNQIDQFSHEAPALNGPMRNLMDENARIFRQIEDNLETLKIQDNIDLFCQTRNNISDILNSMSEMPDIMSRMTPLPVSVDEQLLNTILSGTSQALMFGARRGVHLKQEP